MDKGAEAEGCSDTSLEPKDIEKVIEEEIKEEDQEQEHVVTIPLNNNDTFTCDECGKSKETLKQLIDHKLSHKRIICEKCDKTISYINRLKHANRCKGILHCDEEDCNFQTKYKEIMSRHKRKHQRHLCEDCGHLAKTVSKLKKHKEKFHEARDQRHLCEDCGHVAKTVSKLTKHKEKEHIARDPVVFKCNFCDYKSTHKSHRDTHTKIYCKEKRRLDGIKVSPFTQEDVVEWFSSTNCTKTDFNILLTKISEKYPRILEQGCKVNIPMDYHISISDFLLLASSIFCNTL